MRYRVAVASAFRLLAISFILFTFAVVAQSTTAPAKTSSSPTHSCTIDRALPTEGDTDLAKEDYDAALTFYSASVAKDPSLIEAQLGLVRAFIGKDQLTEATKQSDTMLVRFPQNPLAEVAAAEAAYRAADFLSMRDHVSKALQKDDCEALALAAAAQLYAVNAKFATEATLLAEAHAIRPNDELILRNWIQSLPRKQRAVELAKYLSNFNALSDKDRISYTNEEDHLKARHRGECRITSKTEAVKIPFVSLMRDATHIEAYGVEVQFDGKKRRMQIDTGASGIVLSPSAAKHLGLTPEYHLHTGGVGDEGEVESYLTHVGNIQIGDVQISDCMVEVLGKSKLDVDGLIGLDVFDRWLTTLDYQNEQLLLNPLPQRAANNKPPALNYTDSQAIPIEQEDDRKPKDAIVPAQMKDWIHFIRIGHEILLPAMINGGPLHYMMADTGAGQTILSLAFAKQSGKVHDASEAKFVGISGKVTKTFSLNDATLQFGPLVLPRSSFYAFKIDNVSHDTGIEISGFVGLPTLSRLTVTIDYRDNLLQLKYDPKHDPQRF